MKTYYEVKSGFMEDYFLDPEGSIRSYLQRTRHGYPLVLRTPFYKGKDPNTVLSNWRKHLNTVGELWPSLLSFEDDLAKKVGPMSVMQPLDKRIDDIASYWTGVGGSSKPINLRALEKCLDEWGDLVKSKIRIRQMHETVKRMRLSTNSGNPYFTKRSMVIKDSVPCQVKPDYPWVDMKIGTAAVYWRGAAVLGWRGQEGGPEPEDVKQRVVWMFPFSVNVAELQFYQPAIEEFQRYNYVPAWNGIDHVDAHVTNLFDSKQPEDLIVCTDFTAFDQHINVNLQSAASDLIRELISSTKAMSSEQWLDDVFPIKYMIPLIIDEHALLYGPHGMASGSGGTNFDETLVHRALQHEAALQAGVDLNPYSMCLGDDGIISYPGIKVNDVIKSYTQHGLEMNESKQYASADDCVFLRRWHHKDYRVENRCVGVYSTCRALGRLMFLERYITGWSPRMIALRQLSILENCKYHPMREEFVRFCMKGDKYRLGIDIPGFLTNIQREAEKATDLMPDFLGYTRSLDEREGTSIEDWWIVQYLKSLK